MGSSLFTIVIDKGYWMNMEEINLYLITPNRAFSQTVYIHNLNSKIKAQKQLQRKKFLKAYQQNPKV